MRLPLSLALACLASSAASAAEPSGCDKFAWDIRNEQRILGDATKPMRPSGSEVTGRLPAAFRLELKPFASAGLARPPERTPRDAASFAGFVTLPAVAAGSYKVTLSGEGWIDVVQGGGYLKPEAFSGATDCPSVRKSVKFRLRPEPVTVQVSGATSDSISVAITPAD